MLTVTRKYGESVVLFLPDGRAVRIKHLGSRWGGRLHPGAVRLGVAADEDIAVARGELLERDAGGTLRVRLPRGGR
jgi:sRNA-binding carbon storage regulator CsrA